MKNMNPTLSVLVAACAVLVGGCQPTKETAPTKAVATPEVERKTVEFEQRSPTDLRDHQVQWALEGWSVHSFVTVTQADGMVLRRAELSRPKSSEVERNTVKSVQVTRTNLNEHMKQWSQEGWSVLSFVTVTQANGAVLSTVKLSRPKSSTAPPQ